MRRQKAVYWKKISEDQYSTPSFADPVEVKCRWEDTLLDYRYAQGALSGSQSNVYVDREMFTGDFLMEGAIESDTPESPVSSPKAYEIIAFEKIPNLKVTETLYIAHLGKKA